MHADHSSPTVSRSKMKLRRQLFPREPQVSVVTQTIYASSTSTSTSLPLPVEDTSIPLGPIVGGIAGGVAIVLFVAGVWWWWGSRVRASQAKGPKARRAQDLASNRTGHGKTQSTETLNTSASHSQSSHMSEKSASSLTHTPVKKPSEILAAQKKNYRPVLTHQTTSTTSLASSKYAPLRPSPLALSVVNRSPSAISQNTPTFHVTAPPRPNSPVLSPQSAALRSLVPLPPKVHVVPPSPPPPVRLLDNLINERNARQSVQSVQSVQTVASDYSLDSPVGVAYGGDETAREVYINPRDTRRDSNADVLAQDPFASSGESVLRR